MSRIALLLLASLVVASAANAQQLDVFDPDDFVDPALLDGRVLFVSRLVTGVSRGYMDQYRSVGDDAGFVHLATSVYWRGFQLDVKRSEVRSENPPREDPRGPGFSDRQDASFGSGGSSGGIGTGAKLVSQLSWYVGAGDRALLRFRALHATQYARPETAANLPGLDDRDETRMGQLDAGIRIGRRTQFVTFSYAELTRHGTLAKTKQRTTTIGALLPLVRVGPAVLSPRLTLGAVADTARAIDIVNPSFDLALHFHRSDVNLHLVYSPVYCDGAIVNQFVLYADRALLVRSFGRRRSE